jgi:hypothetical protein
VADENTSPWDSYVKSMPGGEWITPHWRDTPTCIGWVHKENYHYCYDIAFDEFGAHQVTEETRIVVAPLFVFEVMAWQRDEGDAVTFTPLRSADEATVIRFSLRFEELCEGWNDFEDQGEEFLRVAVDVVVTAAEHGTDPDALFDLLDLTDEFNLPDSDTIATFATIATN